MDLVEKMKLLFGARGYYYLGRVAEVEEEGVVSARPVFPLLAGVLAGLAPVGYYYWIYPWLAVPEGFLGLLWQNGLIYGWYWLVALLLSRLALNLRGFQYGLGFVGLAWLASWAVVLASGVLYDVIEFWYGYQVLMLAAIAVGKYRGGGALGCLAGVALLAWVVLLGAVLGAGGVIR